MSCDGSIAQQEEERHHFFPDKNSQWKAMDFAFCNPFNFFPPFYESVLILTLTFGDLDMVCQGHRACTSLLTLNKPTFAR